MVDSCFCAGGELRRSLNYLASEGADLDLDFSITGIDLLEVSLEFEALQALTPDPECRRFPQHSFGEFTYLLFMSKDF